MPSCELERRRARGSLMKAAKRGAVLVLQSRKGCDVECAGLLASPQNASGFAGASAPADEEDRSRSMYENGVGAVWCVDPVRVAWSVTKRPARRCRSDFMSTSLSMSYSSIPIPDVGPRMNTMHSPSNTTEQQEWMNRECKCSNRPRRDGRGPRAYRRMAQHHPPLL